MEMLKASFIVNSGLNLFDNDYTYFFAIHLESHSYGYSILWLDLLSVLSIIFGIFVIITRNPVISVLNVIALFIVISGYLFLTGLNFIALSYILVYIGAVSILFIFVLMLINIRVSELHSYTRNSLFLCILVGIPLYFSVDSRIPSQEFIYSLLDRFNPDKIIKLFHTSLSTSDKWDGNFLPISEISSIGNIIYTSHAMWLLVISVILLLAMLGTIVMTVSPTSFNNSSSILSNSTRNYKLPSRNLKPLQANITCLPVTTVTGIAFLLSATLSALYLCLGSSNIEQLNALLDSLLLAHQELESAYCAKIFLEKQKYEILNSFIIKLQSGDCNVTFSYIKQLRAGMDQNIDNMYQVDIAEARYNDILSKIHEIDPNFVSPHSLDLAGIMADASHYSHLASNCYVQLEAVLTAVLN